VFQIEPNQFELNIGAESNSNCLLFCGKATSSLLRSRLFEASHSGRQAIAEMKQLTSLTID
jgi:hypothetical protein